MLGAVTAAARLPLEIARLRVEVRGQLEAVHASRARIVAAQDAERRRVERDIHDGAQQRLVALALSLQVARRRHDGGEAVDIGELLDQTSAELGAAVEDLRELARGVYPAVLREDGVAEALRALARRTPLAVTVEADLPRLPAGIEAAAYFLASEAVTNAVRHASAAGNRDHRPARRRAPAASSVVDDGIGGADLSRGSGLAGLADRFAALGGTMRDREPTGRRHERDRGAAVRIVIAEDGVLMREGLRSLLAGEGYDVVAQVGDADALRAAVRELAPDLAIIDVRMPPTQTDEGARAAVELRAERPELGVLLLSQDVETRLALTLMEEQPNGFGYLLKDRVLAIDDFLDAVRRVARGGSAIDPEVVLRLMDRRNGNDRLGRAHAARARAARADRRGALERRDRRASLPQPEDGRHAHPQHPRSSSGCRRRRIRIAACSPCWPTSARNISWTPDDRLRMREFDVVVIGAGAAGEVTAGRLGDNGLSVAIVEEALVGGDCSFYACMPSKALLRPVELANEVRRVPGLAPSPIDAAAVLRRRDEVIHDLDDSLAGALARAARRHARARARAHRAAGSRSRSRGRSRCARARPSSSRRARRRSFPTSPACARPGRGRTGRRRPPSAVPPRLAILGGGIVGVEMAQAWGALGSRVTLIHRGPRLIEREEPFASEQVLASLRELGVDVRLGDLGGARLALGGRRGTRARRRHGRRGRRAARRGGPQAGDRRDRPRAARDRGGQAHSASATTCACRATNGCTPSATSTAARC